MPRRRTEYASASDAHRRAAPSRARSHHQPSSSSSPSAFSHPKTTRPARSDSASCRSNQPVGVDAVALERRPEPFDRVFLRQRHPSTVDGEVPGELVAARALTGIRPVDQDRAAVGRDAEVAELPVAVHEGERRLPHGGHERRRVAPERVDRLEDVRRRPLREPLPTVERDLRDRVGPTALGLDGE